MILRSVSQVWREQASLLVQKIIAAMFSTLKLTRNVIFLVFSPFLSKDLKSPLEFPWFDFGFLIILMLRAVRKIVAASLAQSGPPPCFLEKSTYNMLVNPNVDLRSLDKECHLTSTEREHIDKIKGDLNY